MSHHLRSFGPATDSLRIIRVFVCGAFVTRVGFVTIHQLVVCVQSGLPARPRRDVCCGLFAVPPLGLWFF